MTPRWNPEITPDEVPISAAGWLRVAARGSVLGLITFGSLGLLLAVRLVERPLWGQHRPWSPFITQFVCRAAFVVLGMKHTVRGRLMRQKGALVSNHASWLDIFALNARSRIYFVSKSEVATWPFIGWLARATGTVFIRRAARDAKLQQAIFESRLKQGHKLLFFPEGTSTDSLIVLPFKSTLFAAFFIDDLRDILWLQPVTTIYRAPPGEDPRFYGWWGDMEFAPHLLKTLAVRRQGSVEIIYHAPLKVSDYKDRKALAKACEAQVRSART